MDDLKKYDIDIISSIPGNVICGIVEKEDGRYILLSDLNVPCRFFNSPEYCPIKDPEDIDDGCPDKPCLLPNY